MEKYSRLHVNKHFARLQLEIPDSGTIFLADGLSPQSAYGFPPSPQSPDRSPVVLTKKGVLAQAPVRSSQPAPVSPLNINVDGDNVGTNSTECRPFHYQVGEFVLVRCNQSKWLVGQVRRACATGVRVWIGSVQTLVNIPLVLLASHFKKLTRSSLPSSPCTSASLSSIEIRQDGHILAPVECVRPAHLSHRKLYQPLIIFPAGGWQKTDERLPKTPQGATCEGMFSSGSQVSPPSTDPTIQAANLNMRLSTTQMPQTSAVVGSSSSGSDGYIGSKSETVWKEATRNKCTSSLPTTPSSAVTKNYCRSQGKAQLDSVKRQVFAEGCEDAHKWKRAQSIDQIINSARNLSSTADHVNKSASSTA